MRNQFIIGIIFIFLINCTPKNKFYESLPTKIDIDTSLSVKNLVLINSIILEEKDKQIIMSIDNCDFLHDKDLLSIVDISNSSLYLYRISNGKFLKHLETNKSQIADSISMNSKSLPNYFRLNWRFILSKDWKQLNINVENDFIKPSFFMAKFIGSDEILISSVFYVPILSSLGEIIRKPCTAFLHCDLDLNVKKVIAPEANSAIFPQPLQFSFFKDEKFMLISSYSDPERFITNDFDSIEILSIYDESGLYLCCASIIPYCYSNNYLGIGSLVDPYFDEVNGTFYIGFPYCDTIFTLYNKPIFELKNIPFNNNYGFSYYRSKAEPYYKKFKTIIQPTDSGEAFRKKLSRMAREQEMSFDISSTTFHDLMPVSISDIFKIRNNIMIWLTIKDKDADMGYYYFLQEYKGDGTLVKYLKIEDNDKEKLQYVTYDNFSDQLVMFKKTKKNIVMENYKWD